MNSVLWALAIFAAVGVGFWLVSLAIEAMRPKPKPPAKLRWAPEIPIQSLQLGGTKLRYIKSGKNPTLVLLHTLRTQLIIASRRNPRVAWVIAINPYDYAKGRGMARSSIFGWLVTYAALIPIVGETVMRLRNFLIMKAILNGGVADAQSIPPALLKEMYVVGNRPGHYRAFLSLLRNSASWEAATKDYGRIDVPVLLIWGDQDWATPIERKHDRTLIKDAEMTMLQRGGHFLPLDRPEEVRDLIVRFAMPGQ